MANMTAKFFLATAALACGAQCFAQSQGTLTRVITVPDGLLFMVDGQAYDHAFAAFWPAGSKHTLTMDAPLQHGSTQFTQYTFTGWERSGTALQGNTIQIVADPAYSEYRAKFSVQYAVSVRYYPCAAGVACPGSPGVVIANGTRVSGDSDLYFTAGTEVTLEAVANSGWVFAGWGQAPGNRIQGYQDTATMNGPVGVYPQFQQARTVTLNSSPAGLQVMADSMAAVAPISYEWGWGSSHTVGPVSPQVDPHGKWWVFASWSDGGAAVHAYKPAELPSPDSLTATYVPAVAVSLLTAPAGLKLKVDGRDNWPDGNNFVWGPGETHHLEAPARQIDGQGRAWEFAAWTQGGAAAQDLLVPADAAELGLRLTATYKAVGRLTITSSLPGLSVSLDGAACATPCDVQKPVGTEVRLAAPASVPLGAASRADFAGWSGAAGQPAEWTVKLSADPVSLSADYRTMNLLAASADPSDGGAWQMDPASGDGYYDARTTVTVRVSSRPGFRFRGFSGDLSGSEPAGSVAMSAPRAVLAQFDRVPFIAPAGVQNGAGETPLAAVAPGSVVAVFGANLALDTEVGPDSPLRQTLAGVTVRLGDHLLPLYFVSPAQINLQLPVDLAEGKQTLVVASPGQPDISADFVVARNAPGLFGYDADGVTLVLALREDGSLVTAGSPAQPGELLTLLGTGFGPTDRLRPEGFPVPLAPAYTITDKVVVLAGDLTLDSEGALASPGRTGVDAALFRVPAGLPSGANAPLRVRINGQESNTAGLPVK